MVPMSSATLDRFGRIVIPRDIRQRHGWQAGTQLELRDGAQGLEVLAAAAAATVPAGWAWQDGMLVCVAAASGDLGDLAALRDGLDDARDRELGGMP